MYYYKLYGMKIESELEFLPLVLCEDDAVCDVKIQAAPLSEEIQERCKVQMYGFGRAYSWLSNATCQIQVYDGERITYALTGGGNPAWLQTYLLGYGISMLALQKDLLPMHCSVVSDAAGAVLIAGESGTGKSTVTTAFLDAGYGLMADDMALVDGKNVYPAFPYQKLCRDVVIRKGYRLEELSYIDEEKDKFLAPYKGEFSLEAKPVKGFILLHMTGEEHVTVNELTGFERFHVYAGNLFLRKLLKEKKYEPHIGQKCLEMASAVPLLCLGRPEKGDTAAAVVKEAMHWVKSLMSVPAAAEAAAQEKG